MQNSNLYIQEAPSDEVKLIEFLHEHLFVVPVGGGEYKCVKTYSDEACTILDCYAANRSFEDIYRICKTYFPDLTEKQLAQTMFDSDSFIDYLICADIKQLVFFKCDDVCLYTNMNSFCLDYNTKREYKTLRHLMDLSEKEYSVS